MALKSSLHRKSVYNECLSTKKILWIELIDNSLVMIESRQVAFFGVKLLRTGGTSSDAALAVGGMASFAQSCNDTMRIEAIRFIDNIQPYPGN